MDLSAISAYSSTISLINAISPTTRVRAGVGVSNLLAPSVSTNISNLGLLLNASEALGAAATALATPGALAARTATTADAKVATATAGASTPIDSYSVQVKQLAQAQTLTTPPQATSLTAIGNGQATTLDFRFASGASRSVLLTAGNQTLEGIASAINAAGIGIQAQVSGANGSYRLSLTGQTGAANAFTLDVSGNAGIASLLNYPGGPSPVLTSQAQDAQGQVNGTAFTASTNTVSTAVPGLTLQLADVGSTNVTVAANTDQTQKVSDFVDAYNAVRQGLAGIGRDSTSLGLGTFFLRDRLTASVAPDLAGLAQIGITTNANGTLAFDASKFQSALNADAGKVGSVFSNGGNGVADKVAALTADTLSPANLLDVASPILSSPANLALSVQSNLLSSRFDQQNLGSNQSASASLSNQFLLAQLSRLSGFANSQNGTSLLDLLSGSQTTNQNLLGLL